MSTVFSPKFKTLIFLANLNESNFEDQMNYIPAGMITEPLPVTDDILEVWKKPNFIPIFHKRNKEDLWLDAHTGQSFQTDYQTASLCAFG